MTSLNGNGTILTTVRPDIFQIFLQDEDGQNILGIDDGALRQSLRIEIVNTSGQNIEFRSVDNQPSLNNYHFCISFRPGTLLLSQDEDKQIGLKETDEGWQIQQQDNTFYLLLNSSESRVINNGERITLTLENIGAAPSGGSRGTRVEIKYDRLQYQGSNETISGNRLQYLNIVNQRGKKQIPLYVGFLGSNTILNDGSENELTLTIQSLPSMSVPFVSLSTEEVSDVLENSNITRAGSRPESFSVISLKEIQQGKIIPTEEQIADSIIVKPDDSKRTEGILKLRGAHEGTLDEATKFTISFDVVSTESNAPQDWALLNSNDADDVRISVESNQENWGFGGKETQGISPQWSYICQKGWQASGREELLRLKITNLKTLLKAGYANLYVHFENIPGYWDGYITVPIHKGPLVYRETTSGNNQVGCVGIGTDKPQAKLHIKPPSGVDGLKVEGNTAITGNLSVTNANQDANGNTLILGPTNQSNLRLGYDQNYSWIQSHGNKPLAINPIGNNVGIGTTNPGSNKLKVEGNTAIAGNLTVNGSISGNINANKITSGVLNADRIPKSLSLSNLELKTNENRLRMFLYDDAVVLFLDKGRGKNNAQIAWRGGQWTVLSDIRFKTEIENENNILSRLMKLNVKNYRWKDDCEDQAKTIGFIAQDVQPYFPTLVDVWKDKEGYEEKLSLQYSQFGVLAVGGLKELKQEKDSEIAEMRKDFDEKIKELKTEINKFKNR